ncbi:MAG: molybdate ABC transporter permease subunit, partial [Bryobacterales bacterium]|nr:molybdate ABC transporter permease subunit [Bryobacterales bacterium]
MAIDWFPLWLSLRVAALSTFAGIFLSLWIAYYLAFKSFRGKEILDAMVSLPLVLPPTVL